MFADSYFYLAFLNERDEGHAQALSFAKSFQGSIITTEWVLAEVADALSAPAKRPRFAALMNGLRANPQVTIVHADHEGFERGLQLYNARDDKSWSLTDCISFVVMQEHGVSEALSGDRHFEQAGFVPLLA